MVRTRSSVASEPLKKLATPPKRTRKANKKPISKHPSPLVEVKAASPVKEIELIEESQDEEQAEKENHAPLVVEDIEVKTSTRWELNHSALDIESLTALIEDTPSMSDIVTVDTSVMDTPVSNKRARDDSEDDATNVKRSRTQNSPLPVNAEEALFPKKLSAEQLDEDLANATPVRSYAEQIRRDRRRRELARRNNRLGITPRGTNRVKLEGDNPFGIETFSEHEKAEMAKLQAAQRQAKQPSVEREKEQREDRSAAPEPETPRRGLLGSLRDLGSAALSRFGSPFGNSTPGASTPKSATAPHARTEPRRRPVRVWDIQYPEIESVQDETHSAQAAREDEPNPEEKRQIFEAKHGKPDRAYDHLHTVPAEGDVDHPSHSSETYTSGQTDRPPVSDAVRAAADARRARRERLFGKTPVKDAPAVAPLFGPNSHYARGTKNPQYLEFTRPGVHPAYRKFAGDKRSFAETLPEIPITSDAPASRTFQPYSEDAAEMDEGPVTPAPKRQKTADSAPQTPRSALKAPGTIGRSGRSARFNEDPVASVKRMSPIFGTSPAGEYPYSRDNLFNTFEDERSHQKDEDITMLSDPSPTTAANTLRNTGSQGHPGDLLTTAINPPGLDNVRFEWSDPNDPSWRPSLANPRPGHFRVPDLDEEMEGEDVDSTNESIQLDTPPQPSTPRMSHAELPKQASTTHQTPLSASALEAANLERRRAEATKTKPRTSSRLAEVTTARSRSPSPPGLDTDEANGSDASAKTPSPTMGGAENLPTWTWSAETNEYISSSSAYPDFAYNPDNELVPSFCLQDASKNYDKSIVGPDKMTEAQRQKHYAQKYNDAWAEKEFAFDEPQTYEDAGVGSKYIHDLIRKNDARYPEVVKQCDERFASEWDAHQEAIDSATRQGKKLVATYPDRDGVEMQDDEL